MSRKPTVNKHKAKTAKYRFVCVGPEFVTEYNISASDAVKDRCIQEPKFNPAATCHNHTLKGEAGLKCPYLEVKKYG